MLWIVTLLMLTGGRQARGQEHPPYELGPTNSFGVFVAYSNDSSHILMGDAERRKLVTAGVSYSRRILAGRAVSWNYSMEFAPLAFEGDPLSRDVAVQRAPFAVTAGGMTGPTTSCSPVIRPYAYVYDGAVYSGTFYAYCHGRLWTRGEAMSPIGFRWNFRPARTMQPFLVVHGGYWDARRPIPIEPAGTFNFTFDFGAGMEVFRTPKQSVRAEFRFHHLSNAWTADQNPGIDSGQAQVTYCFGR